MVFVLGVSGPHGLSVQLVLVSRAKSNRSHSFELVDSILFSANIYRVYEATTGGWWNLIGDEELVVMAKAE